ncbi:MAG: hypothetical protein R3E76_07780 [Planctomycetota bacterium]
MSGEPEPTDGHPLRRAFLWGALFGTLGVFALPLVPVFNTSGGGRDARKAEAIQLSSSARDVARISFAHSKEFNPLLIIGTTESVKPLPDDFHGKYFATINVVSYISPEESAIYSIPASNEQPVMRQRFRWISGESEFEELGPFGRETP